MARGSAKGWCSFLREEIAVVTLGSGVFLLSAFFRADLNILPDRIVKIIPVFCAQSLGGNFLFEFSFSVEYAHRIKHVSLSSSPKGQVSAWVSALGLYSY